MDLKNIYELHMVKRIIAGVRSADRTADVLREFGADRAVILTDEGVLRAGLIEKPKRLLEDAGIQVKVLGHVPPEPEIGQVAGILEEVKAAGCRMLLGIGGGSTMDTAKLISVLMTNGCRPEELIGAARTLKKGIPTLMMPTTAGTGSEVTQNAVVTIPEQKLKVGIVNTRLLPDCVILDPMMTLSLPPAITASTGMDALTHALECYISLKANPFSDTLALKSIGLIYGSIRRAYAQGGDIAARQDMLLGSMLGGMCIAASGTAAVHALAYPLGGRYRIPHGVSNAMLLPYVMEFNADSAAEKMRRIAAELDPDSAALPAEKAARKVVEGLYALARDLNIPSSLREYGISEKDLDALTEAALRVTRLLGNNPKKMSGADIRNIYARLL